MQFVVSMFGLAAVPAVMLRGCVEPVVRLGDSSLTMIVVLGRCPGCSRKGKHAKKCRSSEHHLSEKLLLSYMKRHVSSILPKYPQLGWGLLFHKTHLWRECSKSWTTQ